MLNLLFFGSLIAPFPGAALTLASMASAPYGRPEIERSEGDVFTRPIELYSEFELIRTVDGRSLEVLMLAFDCTIELSFEPKRR